ncbi:MAG: FAD-binding oxidoreductase [Alphaproteobacteria bacterium]|nr:FAD-binding oxidoreductase [Rhodospirillaceae bacterium]MBT6204369.1 FAD-binding oxidoreductase [Rhodospirillaceae bacterium]MBT6510184.1 FAD-binding oxidoreductase [Rhodospirillaceae bacterium]MDG2479392.1 FAD-binding oxidoreductase [Alphaproteobacteria bacterium]
MAELYHPSIYRAEKHVDSYWAASAGSEVEGWAPLDGDQRCEVAVIGGGYTGMSAALHLARDYHVDVRILEAGPPGWGASGRNGGFVGPDSSKLGLSELKSTFGDEGVRAYYRNGLEAIDLVKNLGQDEGIDFAPQGDGELGVAHTASRMEGMDDWARAWGDMLGRKVEVWQQAEMAERGYTGPEAFGAYFTHAGFALHPMKFARGLAQACIRRGVKFHGHSEVTAWEKDGPRHRLRTPGGTLTADKVIIATNGFTRDKLHPGVAGTLLPALSNIIVTRQMSDAEVARHNWVTECPVWNTRTLVFYYRMIQGNRFMLGARAATRNTEAATETYRRWLIERFHEMWPEWRDIDIEYFWRGFVCLSAARVPHIGELPESPGVWHAFGYHGGGVGWATYSGQAVARLIAGNEPAENWLSPVVRSQLRRFPLPWMRLWYLRAAYLWYGMKDRR